jgi:putative toxin-antitoxin system antitoxin component (TIGR02293 family)
MTGGVQMNTLVIEDLFGGFAVLGRRIDTEMDLYELGKKGLPKKALLHFAKSVNMSIRALTGILSITERTLQRKKDTDLLSECLSEHLLQLAEVYSRGEEVFSDIEIFKMWMDTSNRAFGNKRPNDLLSSRYGAQMVLHELGRIEHGIIS